MQNKLKIRAPTMPRLASTPIGKLEARTLPFPTPNPNVSKKFCSACSFHAERSMPEAVESLLSTIVSIRFGIGRSIFIERNSNGSERHDDRTHNEKQTHLHGNRSAQG